MKTKDHALKFNASWQHQSDAFVIHPTSGYFIVIMANSSDRYSVNGSSVPSQKYTLMPATSTGIDSRTVHLSISKGKKVGPETAHSQSARELRRLGIVAKNPWAKHDGVFLNDHYFDKIMDIIERDRKSEE